MALLAGLVTVTGGWFLLTSLLPGTERQQLVRLNVSADSWAGYFLLRQGQEPDSIFGKLLNQQGIILSYEDEPDQSSRARKLREGTYQIAMTSADQVLLQPFGGHVVTMVDVSDGGDAVVLRKGLRSIDDIKPGMKVAYARATPSETLLKTLALRFAAVDLKRLEPVTVQVADQAWALLQEGKVDVAVVWQPFTGLARKAGYTVALTSADAKNVILDVLLASDKADPLVVRKFVAAYCQALDYYLAQPDRLRTAIGADSRTGGEALADLSNGIQFVSCTKTDRTWFSSGFFARRQAVIGEIVGAKAARNLIDSNALLAYTREDERRRRAVAALDPTLVAPIDIARPSSQFVALRPQEALKRPVVGALRVDPINFATDSSSLTQAGVRTLERLKTTLGDFPDLRVLVIGHTSRTGDSTTNQKLSQARSAAVVNFFVSRGYAPGRFVALGYGADQPLKGTNPASPINQRTEFKLFR